MAIHEAFFKRQAWQVSDLSQTDVILCFTMCGDRHYPRNVVRQTGVITVTLFDNTM